MPTVYAILSNLTTLKCARKKKNITCFRTIGNHNCVATEFRHRSCETLSDSGRKNKSNVICSGQDHDIWPRSEPCAWHRILGPRPPLHTSPLASTWPAVPCCDGLAVTHQYTPWLLLSAKGPLDTVFVSYLMCQDVDVMANIAWWRRMLLLTIFTLLWLFHLDFTLHVGLFDHLHLEEHSLSN